MKRVASPLSFRRERGSLLAFLFLAVSGCGAPCPPLACVGTVSVRFVDSAGAPLPPERLALGAVEFVCGAPGVTCAGNSMTVTDVLEGVALTSARATSGASFTGPLALDWRTSGEAAGSCCGGARTASATVPLIP